MNRRVSLSELRKECARKTLAARILAGPKTVTLAGLCNDPPRLIGTISALLTHILPALPVDGGRLYSGRVDTGGAVLGHRHHRFTLSAEWDGLGRLPIGQVEYKAVGDEGYRFELARYDTPTELQADGMTERLFDTLIHRLNVNQPGRA